MQGIQYPGTSRLFSFLPTAGPRPGSSAGCSDGRDPGPPPAQPPAANPRTWRRRTKVSVGPTVPGACALSLCFLFCTPWLVCPVILVGSALGPWAAGLRARPGAVSSASSQGPSAAPYAGFNLAHEDASDDGGIGTAEWTWFRTSYVPSSRSGGPGPRGRWGPLGAAGPGPRPTVTCQEE